MDDNQRFEWTFVVDAIQGPGDERIDRLFERADASVASHGGVPLVTVVSEGGPTAVEAAQTAVRVIVISGFDVKRSHRDLVSRADIADRAGVTRQAVTHWLGGKRRDDEPFPQPVNLVGGGAWLWSDVNGWLARNVNDVSDGLTYPTLEDHTIVDYEIAVGKMMPSRLRAGHPAQIGVLYAGHADAAGFWGKQGAALATFAFQLDAFKSFTRHATEVPPDVSDVVEAMNRITSRRDPKLEDLLRD